MESNNTLTNYKLKVLKKIFLLVNVMPTSWLDYPWKGSKKVGSSADALYN